MSLQKTIKDKIKEALKTKDKVGLRVYRSLTAAFTNELVATGQKPDGLLTDSQALVVIKRQARQRQDSIDQFTAGNRKDLVAQEQAELKIIETFLPAEMSAAEIEKLVQAKKIDLNITDKSQLGILIGAVLKEAGGTASGKIVKDIAEKELS
jgi:uncharacterized protein